ncbi:hypothetical protein M758_11G069100 [Ceratodon purpureus]|uniref:PAR1 protein n=1 Tax=Ceratodon purpureus TaxID=3225 RepID=A0A8T0GDT4_CERPU|nr:hypothetical protein KC19_11G071000 [Ceratodon purpureus]KAG0600896.1 hypothetical protein M758_11G069100 [Ceratodon purpureus]
MVATMAKRQLATVPLIIGLVLANLVSTFGKLECEDLPVEDCAFSVASSGTRCVLEKYKGKDDSIRYECQSSLIMAEKQEEWIESDECVKSCGLERMTVGLSTDLLMDSHFTERLCSSECLNNCPNLLDLYISLAAGEGMYLPQLCKSHRMTSRRSIADPVKKAMDAEHQRLYLQQLISEGALGPAGSQTPESGADTGSTPGSTTPGTETPPGGGIQKSGPGYDYRGEIAPSSPISIPPLQKAPGALAPTAGGPSTSKRPFFTFTSPPTPEPTPAAGSIAAIPGQAAATPATGAAASIPPESTPFIFETSAPEMAPSPSPEQGSEDLFWQERAAEKGMLDRSQLNDEEYLYETYFH